MKVLVAAPDNRTHILINKLSLSLDFQMLSVMDGDEAYLRIHQEKPDLVICELDMPNLDGFDLVQRLNHVEKMGIPFIFTGEFKSRQTILEALRLGVRDFIAKPFDSNILRFRIRNAIIRTKKPSFVRIEAPVHKVS